MATIGIAGAGLLGRLLAWRLSHAGHQVSVFEESPQAAPSFDGHGAAAFTAAGMLSPLAELESSSPGVARLGLQSIVAWQQIAAALPNRPFFAQKGSLLVAHRTDLAAAERVLERLRQAADRGMSAQPLEPGQLRQIEPALAEVAHAWLLSGEGQLDVLGVMAGLVAGAAQARWHFGASVTRVEPGRLQVAGEDWQRFDVVFDVRGVGARPDLPVRGVRGETICLHAPGLGLTRPVRVLHPRHRVYIVPRPDEQVIIGASQIESEDRSPVSVRTAVELLTAAHSVLPQLAEARIVRLDRNLRPALPDNEPHMDVGAGLIRINGLYRHGWLVAPALVDQALTSAGLAGEPAQAAVAG